MLLAGSTALASGVGQGDPNTAATPHPEVLGAVVDEHGKPVAGAMVKFGDASDTTNARGQFSLPATAAGWGRASADGHLPRNVVLEPGHPREVTLTRNTAGTVSIRFGGDVMMGRRFYESTSSRGPLITSTSGSAGHAALLREVRPLLEDSDLAVVNLETPMLPDPYYDPDEPRPDRFHPTKDLAFGTDPALAQGLAAAGIDAVALGNNHVMDALGPGIGSTIKALDAAGVVHFGAGRDEDEAWRPATVDVRGQTVAFVGCTTVAGEAHAIPYVAGPHRAGAALCDPDRLRQSISLALKKTDTVIAMLHGDVEYRRQQTPLMRQLAKVAQEAGARTVIGSHPHVVGGLVGGKGTLFAETTGNLVFDQDLWPTFPSYLLRVDLRRGIPVQASTDPLVIDDYQPRPAVGAFADAVSRIAAGTVPGSARLGGPGAFVNTGLKARTRKQTRPLFAGVPENLAPGWWVDPSSAKGVRFGSDLLFGTGGFEPLSVGGDAGHLWDYGKYARVSTDAGCVPEGGTVGHGTLLARGPLSTQDVVAHQNHRSPVSARSDVTLLADVRRASVGGSLEIHWYSRRDGKSVAVSTLDLPVGTWGRHDCRTVRLDVTPPASAHYAEVFVRVTPPVGGQTVRRVAVDNIQLVQWTATPTSGLAHNVIESNQDTTVPALSEDASDRDEPFMPHTGVAGSD